MALDPAAVRIAPLLAGTVATMVMGAVWYGIFAKPWSAMAHPGRTREELQLGPKWPYAIAAAAALAMSYVFGVVTAAVGSDLATGVRLAALLSIVLLLLYLTTYSFAYKPGKLAAIDVGYYGRMK